MCSEGETEEEWFRLLTCNCENFHVKVLLISVVLDRVENGYTSVSAIVLNTVMSRSSDTVLNATLSWRIQYGSASEAIYRIEYGTVISNDDRIEYGYCYECPSYSMRHWIQSITEAIEISCIILDIIYGNVVWHIHELLFRITWEVWDVNRNLFIVHWQLKYHIHLLNRHILTGFLLLAIAIR